MNGPKGSWFERSLHNSPENARHNSGTVLSETKTIYRKKVSEWLSRSRCSKETVLSITSSFGWSDLPPLCIDAYQVHSSINLQHTQPRATSPLILIITHQLNKQAPLWFPAQAASSYTNQSCWRYSCKFTKGLYDLYRRSPGKWIDPQGQMGHANKCAQFWQEAIQLSTLPTFSHCSPSMAIGIHVNGVWRTSISLLLIFDCTVNQFDWLLPRLGGGCLYDAVIINSVTGYNESNHG